MEAPVILVIIIYYFSYYSGRRAVSFSRKGDGSRGLYCIVYDDSESNNIIAYFMPTGHTACYHKNGGLHMLTDPTGGLLLDEVSLTHYYYY